jgi:hypothetical protein
MCWSAHIGLNHVPFVSSGNIRRSILASTLDVADDTSIDETVCLLLPQHMNITTTTTVSGK